jgi:transposase
VLREEAARTFSVSLPTIERWLKRRRETGGVEPRPILDSPSVKDAALEGWLPSHLRENDDLTLEEHREAFEEAHGGTAVSASTGRGTIALLPEGWPLKKVPSSLPARRAGEGRLRRTDRVDESEAFGAGGQVRDAHLHNARQGEGAQGKEGARRFPRNRGKNTTLITFMTLEGGMGEAIAVEGATNAKVFEAYVEGFLALSLSAGQIVLLVNFGTHKPKRLRELVEARGAQVWFLPAYLPDLNPTEEAFSKEKSLLKKAAARTKEGLLEAMPEALAAVTPEDARGWFAHSRYVLRDQSL